MQYKWSIIIIAVFVAMLPFLGFSGNIRDAFISIGGLSIAVIVFFGNEISHLRWKGNKFMHRSDSYVENENIGDDSSFPKV